MERGHDAEAIGVAASRLFASGAVGDAQLRATARVGLALPVLTPDGTLNSWFVPLTVGEILAAFMQILPDGTLMRFSSFQRRAGDLEGCPASADWLDTARIAQRAQAERRAHERAGEPFLTFDRNPDRLVWSVPFTDAGGVTRHVHVVGTSVYAPTQSGGVG